MLTLVVDSSVAPKWWLPEVDAITAGLLRTVPVRLIAPNHFLGEMTNVMTQAARSGRIARADADEFLTELVALSIDLIEISPLMHTALDLAVRLHPSAYDCLYAALAIREQCPVVTADRKFYDAIAPVFPENMLWIEDLPAFLAADAS